MVNAPPVPVSSPDAVSPMGHPRGLYTLFFTEMWERFSYYGMRALLVLYLVDQVRGGMGMSKVTAAAIYGLYTSAVYLVALPGGWFADRLLGARRAVWYGGIIIAAGHFTLAVPSPHAFFFGLILIIAGTGLLKPNMSVLVGDLYPEGGARRDMGFTIFYMGVNLGATIGPLICAFLGEQVNWHYGFAAAGVGMVLGLIQYKMTGHYLGNAGLQPRHRHAGMQQGFDKAWLIAAAGLAVCCGLVLIGFIKPNLFNPVQLRDSASYLIVGVGVLYFVGILIFGHLSALETNRIFVLLILLLAAIMFFAGFEQAGSSFNLFAESYTVRSFLFFKLDWLHIPGFHYEIPAGWFQMINSIFIIMLAPVMAALWGFLGRRQMNPSLPAKFAYGMILLGAGFLVMIAAANLVLKDTRVVENNLVGTVTLVGPSWLIITYLIHTFAELCLSPVGLSAVTKLAPHRFVGQMMGLWFLATSLGNLIASRIAGEVSEIQKMPGSFWNVFLISAGIGLVLLVFSRPIKKLMGDIE